VLVSGATFWNKQPLSYQHSASIYCSHLLPVFTTICWNT